MDYLQACIKRPPIKAISGRQVIEAIMWATYKKIIPVGFNENYTGIYHNHEISYFFFYRFPIDLAS